jgi:hypothetical protein
MRGIVNLTARSRGRTRSTHSRNAVEGEFDSLAGQRFSFVGKQHLGGESRLVARAEPPAAGVARLSLCKRPPAHPFRPSLRDIVSHPISFVSRRPLRGSDRCEI